jgi:hypothetical protein
MRIWHRHRQLCPKGWEYNLLHMCHGLNGSTLNLEHIRHAIPSHWCQAPDTKRLIQRWDHFITPLSFLFDYFFLPFPFIFDKSDTSSHNWTIKNAEGSLFDKFRRKIKPTFGKRKNIFYTISCNNWFMYYIKLISGFPCGRKYTLCVAEGSYIYIL